MKNNLKITSFIFLFFISYSLKLEAYELDCLIEPNTDISISTAVEGVISEVKVERGDVVRKNQLLVKLESGVQEANVNLAKARYNLHAGLAAGKVRLAYAQRKYDRSSELHKNKFISTDKKDDIETERRLAELKNEENRENQYLAKMQLESATADLELRNIRSPIDGIVVERFLSSGELAQAQPIMRVASIDPLYIEVISHTQFYNKIKKGMVAIIKPEEPIGGAYKAVVTHVDSILDSASGTFNIRLEMPNKDNKIPAGAECKVEFPDIK